MELKIKLLKWSAGIPVAMLNKKTAGEMGIHSNERISVETLSRRPKTVTTIVDLTDNLVGKKEIGVSSELKKRLGLRIGQKIAIDLAKTPESMKYIQKKLNNKSLSKKETSLIINDVVSNSLSGPEVALFVSGMYKSGMTMRETIYLIDAIVGSGVNLNFHTKLIADKHSIGGIPGNRTTPVIVSICAAAGLVMPKTSSRAITSAAGTADVIETIAQVEFSIPELKKIVKKANACLVWGGALEMVPADSKIIKIEKQLNIDPESQLLASILSKKISVGSRFILIDIPCGEGAKVDRKKALRLKRKFEYLGKHYHKKLKVVLTDGTQPIGNGIGPALELMDVINILHPKKKGPRDLERKSLFLAGELLELTGRAKKGKGIKMAEKILDSGKAFEKFREIIRAQKGNVNGLRFGKYSHNIVANKSGKISKVQNKKIAALARVAGCPTDKFAGIYLCVQKGDKIKKGDKILTIYAESKLRLRGAIRFYKRERPVVVG